ncbi:MAG: hypothetical protein JW732_08055 [Dehalococcoidia bacterium]|nr:hypothetical protein [Dehalococcoidia bacterium]
MEVGELVKLFNDVSGLDENQAKVAIYYAMATNHLSKFGWFPALVLVGALSTGGSPPHAWGIR